MLNPPDANPPPQSPSTHRLRFGLFLPETARAELLELAAEFAAEVDALMQRPAAERRARRAVDLRAATLHDCSYVRRVHAEAERRSQSRSRASANTPRRCAGRSRRRR